MAGPKPKHHCAVCSQTFRSKQALYQHMENHPDATSQQLECASCGWAFDDSFALENHLLQTGHRAASFECDNCFEKFQKLEDFKIHRKFPSECSDAFRKRTPANQRNQSPVSAEDHLSQLPKDDAFDDLATSIEELDCSSSEAAPRNFATYCNVCEKDFKTPYAFNNHFLACRPVKKSTATTPATGAYSVQPISAPMVPVVVIPSKVVEDPLPQPKAQNLPPRNPAPEPVTQPPRPASTPTEVPTSFACSVKSCKNSYRSEQALKIHQADAHGIGGQALDLLGKDSWMLSQRERDRLMNEGFLRPAPRTSPLPGRGRGNRGPTLPPRPSAPPGRGRGNREPSVPPIPIPPPNVTQSLPATAVGNTQPSVAENVTSGAAEMDQGKLIHDKMLRLVLQSDIFIHPHGTIYVGDSVWTRINVARQAEVASMLEGLCHLPRALQGEYLPPPKTFRTDYKVSPPSSEFKPSPERNNMKPALDVIVISCSSIARADGVHEVVKVAAVDVLTCRILLNHLVCTDPKTRVADWCAGITGLSDFNDMEAARKAGYKIFKGWQATREALWKFVDKETIIVGHNLRRELDALRMIHGRAVDTAKLFEKAAKGPLSKAQLSLDSLCRDYPKVKLSNDLTYGRDCLQNAFAARGIAIWIVKNKEEFEKSARQKSLDYQKANPLIAA